jgi:hypothetical protein
MYYKKDFLGPDDFCHLIPNSTFANNFKFYINHLKPDGYFTHHQVLFSTFLHVDYIAFMRFLWISKQTVTFAL